MAKTATVTSGSDPPSGPELASLARIIADSLLARSVRAHSRHLSRMVAVIAIRV
jgi:hypothetical protein